MPVFEYKGLDGRAKNCTGVIDAETPRDAREKLRTRKIYVTELEPVGEKKKKEGQKKSALSFLPRIELGRGKRQAGVGQFTRQLATLLKAGIPLVQSLNALIEQVQEKALQTVIRDIREKISSGTDFGDALADHPSYFAPLYRSMVKAGEASGELDEVLTRLADFMQKQTRLRAKIVSALTYPGIMICISVAVVIYLMVFVVPDITQILEEQEIPKPLPTQIVTGAADLLTEFWYVFLLAALSAWALFQAWKSTDKGHYAWDRFMLRAPILGSLFTKTSVSRFSTTFSVLLKSGLPALDSLKIVKDVVGNLAMSRVIEKVHDSIIEGTDISTPIKKSGFFPPVVGYMIAVGEQTGELEELLDRISKAYDEEVDLAVQRMTSVIEPIMIVFMAVVVGGIIASVMLPLMQISSGGVR